jgi:hypothetical protein
MDSMLVECAERQSSRGSSRDSRSSNNGEATVSAASRNYIKSSAQQLHAWWNRSMLRYVVVMAAQL